MLTALPRATGIGDANGHRTRYYPHVTAPAKQVRAVPLAPAGTAAAEQPRSSPQPRRRPRRPRQRPRQQSCHGLCSSPRRSRAFHAAHAPRQRLTQACAPGQPLCGFRGVEHPASQAGTLDSSGSSATPFFNPCSGTKCLPQNGVAGGHITVSAIWSRHSAQHDGGSPSGDAGTPPNGGFFFTRGLRLLP